MKHTVRKGLMVLCLAVFVFSAWKVYGILGAYQEGTEHYEQLEQFVSAPVSQPQTTQPKPETVPGEAMEQAQPPESERIWTGPEVDFAALAQINSEVVGWLSIEGTPIQYPVVQGADNSFYLNHRFDRAYNTAGCLFLDAEGEGDFSGQNNVIYGHYMNNGSMFAALKKYKQQEFYDAHPTGWLVTPTGRYEIRFFAGYVSDTSGWAWNLNFGDGEYEAWLNDRVKESCFVSEVRPDEGDRVITLSTCSYEFDNARFVLHGVLTAWE